MDYDKMNSVIDRQSKMFYAASTTTSLGGLTYATYCLRYRTLHKPQVLMVGTAFYLGF